MGAGLAVVPLMGLLESIAVAKSFGKMPATHSLPGVSLQPTCLAHLLSLFSSALMFETLNLYLSNTCLWFFCLFVFCFLSRGKNGFSMKNLFRQLEIFVSSLSVDM